mgnify:CR=1 FL=1
MTALGKALGMCGVCGEVFILTAIAAGPTSDGLVSLRISDESAVDLAAHMVVHEAEGVLGEDL